MDCLRIVQLPNIVAGCLADEQPKRDRQSHPTHVTKPPFAHAPRPGLPARQAAWAGAADTFAAKCAGCHLGGGNVLQPGATLFTEDLQVRACAARAAHDATRLAVRRQHAGYSGRCATAAQSTGSRSAPGPGVAPAAHPPAPATPAAQRPRDARGSL